MRNFKPFILVSISIFTPCFISIAILAHLRYGV